MLLVIPCEVLKACPEAISLCLCFNSKDDTHPIEHESVNTKMLGWICFNENRGISSSFASWSNVFLRGWGRFITRHCNWLCSGIAQGRNGLRALWASRIQQASTQNDRPTNFAFRLGNIIECCCLFVGLVLRNFVEIQYSRPWVSGYMHIRMSRCHIRPSTLRAMVMWAFLVQLQAPVVLWVSQHQCRVQSCVDKLTS